MVRDELFPLCIYPVSVTDLKHWTQIFVVSFRSVVLFLYSNICHHVPLTFSITACQTCVKISQLGWETFVFVHDVLGE